MIDRIWSMVKVKRNKRALYGVMVIMVAFELLPAGLLVAQESAVRQSYVMDSSNERTPAITAFPIYPRIARRDRIEGEAIVCFRISMDGRVRSIRVKSYSNRIFRRPALRAIKDSSFEPLRPHEIYSSARTCRTYRFRLEPVEAADAA